uniref:Methyltransferase type 11 domain-containing protein n=1 Tax=Salmo trutta TaxID=8032 RepID=A0A673XCW7_SALTR
MTIFMNFFMLIFKFTLGNGPLRILEIGCGSGANFEFYPSGCKVVCTDPSPYFDKYLQKSLAVNDHLMFESFVVASDIGAVKNESVDVVVCTLALCFVNDIPRTLQEAQRIETYPIGFANSCFIEETFYMHLWLFYPIRTQNISLFYSIV